MLLHGGEPRRWSSRRQLVRGFRNLCRVLGAAALFMPPSEGQEPRALTVAAQAIEGRKCAETAKVHPDLRIVYNLAYGVLAGEAGRFSLVGDYTTTIQRPTVLGWAFSFAESARHAGFRAVLRVPPAGRPTATTCPVRPCFALSSLETCANFFAVAHADGVFRQWFVRVPMGMVGSRVCTSKAQRQTREASLHVSPWAGTDHDRSCCAHGSGRHALG